MRPQFPMGFSGPGYPPPPASSATSNSLMFLLLLVACIALGAALGFGLRERTAAGRLTQERNQLAQRNWEVENAYAVVLAKRNDLARFLVDPRTRLYRLSASAQAGGHGLTIAWQDATRNGVLIGDQMPMTSGGKRYAIWLVGADSPHKAGSFAPEGAMTCVEFRTPEAEPSAQGFLISLEDAASVREPGTILYRSR